MKKSIASGGIGAHGERNPMDFYPTPPEVTVALLNFLDSLSIVDKVTTVCEPASGSGSMSRVLEKRFKNVLSSDIRLGCYGVSGMDFIGSDWYWPFGVSFDAVITNPPFYESENFIKKARRISPIVCMLLKSQYWHSIKRKQLFDSDPPQYVCPLTWRPNFIPKEIRTSKGGGSLMDFCWSIWCPVSGGGLTYYCPLEKSNTLLSEKLFL